MTDIRQDRIQSFAYVIGVFFCICLFVLFIFNPARFSSKASGIEIVLENRINPNNATAESLIRLPGVGPVRAAALIEYRQELYSKNPGKPAFENLKDLQNVNGIGPRTAETIAPWLKFE